MAELKNMVSNNAEQIVRLLKSIQLKEEGIKLCRAEIETYERESAQGAIYISHLDAIYRLAKYQFSRLNNRLEQSLTDLDMAELDKWINRAKSEEGLIHIKNALEELDKYMPSEIKTNLYALVQKIIIGGANKWNKGKTP